MASYSKKIIQEMTQKALEKPSTLYQQSFVNYKGCVDGIRYTEIVAAELLQNIDKLYKIEPVSRETSYDMGHTGATKAKRNERSNKSEKMLAINLFKQGTNHSNTIGTIFDYEVPLAKEQIEGVKGEGDIDLVSQAEDCIYLLELKREDNLETLLRCVLEIYTYYRQLQHKKFVDDFVRNGKIIKPLEIKKAIIVFKEKTAHNQYIEKEENANTIALMMKLGVKLFTLCKDGEIYKVTQPLEYASDSIY